MDDAQAHEIVIIKRVSGGGEDGHHGGAWKIAFADFMTAMMALFLVLWLIAASDKTKAVISKYFNPVQLVDSTPQPPGLSDPKPGQPSTPAKEKKSSPPQSDQKPKPAPAEGQQKPAEGKPTSEHSDSDLFKDPYAVLAELSAHNSQDADPKPARAPTQGDQGGSGAVGVRGGEAYRDPFEPLGVATDASLGGAEPKPVEVPAETPPPAALTTLQRTKTSIDRDASYGQTT